MSDTESDRTNKSSSFHVWAALERTTDGWLSNGRRWLNFSHKKSAGLKADTQGKIKFLVLYGSLRRGSRDFDELQLSAMLRFVGPCEFSGTLLDLIQYPGVTLPNRDQIGRTVHGELYEIVDESVIPLLDNFERYNSADEDRPLMRQANTGSLYVRRMIDLRSPIACRAYVYEYNGEIINGALRTGPVIESGDWLSHLAQRSSQERAAS